jgi:hypothetical protein
MATDTETPKRTLHHVPASSLTEFVTVWIVVVSFDGGDHRATPETGLPPIDFRPLMAEVTGRKTKFKGFSSTT